MSNTIRIKMMDKEVEIDLSTNTLTVATVKSQFLLPWDSIVALSYEVDGRRIGCNLNEEGTRFILPADFPNIKFNVRSNRALPKPATSAGVECSIKRLKIDPELEPLPVNGDVVSRINQYAWFYTKGEDKRSAIPVTKNLAITYRHGENKSFVMGDSVKLTSYQNQKVVVDTCVVLIEDVLDLIVFQSKSAEICDRDLIMEAVVPKRGMNYVLMGYSVIHRKTSQITFSAGIISSDRTPRYRFLGSSGSLKGDDGGSCWSDDGKLIGMQVEAAKVPHTNTTINNGRPVYPATGGRCEIIPFYYIHGAILKLIPPEEDVEWNE